MRRTILRDSWDLLRLDLRGPGGSVYRGPIGMAARGTVVHPGAGSW